MSNTFYDIMETAADGSEVSFKKFEGKVVYGVNVASEWVIRAEELCLQQHIQHSRG